MLTLATYVSVLEADKQKLKAQVKRLCAENNWLRKELTEHQQLLQETEISLAKVKEEKEHLGFLLEQQRVCQYIVQFVCRGMLIHHSSNCHFSHWQSVTLICSLAASSCPLLACSVVKIAKQCGS